MKGLRLDKYLSKALQKSRTEVLTFIKRGQICINEQIVLKKDALVYEKDQITLDGIPLTYHNFIYIMLNKPQGVVSAVKDNLNKTVINLLSPPLPVFPIGRLDIDTEGLLLLTNNGALSHFLTSPNHHISKRYFVITKKKMESATVDAFKTGLDIYDGNKNLFKTKPATLEIINDVEAYVTIFEGKYHQIKKMFKKCNNEVVYLKRIAMGGITLDDQLKLGEYRYLTQDEIDMLKKPFDEKIK